MAVPVGHTEAEPDHSGSSAFAKIGVLVIAGFVSASLTLILLVVGSAYSASRAGNASLQVEQAERLAATLDRIVINILRAEIAQLLIQSRDAAGSDDDANDEATDLADALQKVEDNLQILDATVAEQRSYRDAATHLRQLFSMYLDARRNIAPAPGRSAIGALTGSTALDSVRVSSQMHMVASDLIDDQATRLQRLRMEEYRTERTLQACYLLVASAVILIFAALCRHVWSNLLLQSRLRHIESVAQHQLEARVSARTAELYEANARLHAEIVERSRVQSELTESQEAIRLLLSHQAARMEEERKHIAREVHDDLAQDIFIMRLALRKLQARTGSKHGRLYNALQEGVAQTDRLLAAVRSLINNLRPEVLELGFLVALRWHLQGFARRTGLTCKFSSNVEYVDISEARAITLFRIFQEATANIARHAQARSVSVTLTLDDDNLTLCIADDGVGFDSSAKRKEGSFGLLGIFERTAAVNGRIEIQSSQHNGTTVRVEVTISDSTHPLRD